MDSLFAVLDELLKKEVIDLLRNKYGVPDTIREEGDNLFRCEYYAPNAVTEGNHVFKVIYVDFGHRLITTTYDDGPINHRHESF